MELVNVITMDIRWKLIGSMVIFYFYIVRYQRGEGYASYSIDFPSRLKIVAIAEPLQHRYHYEIWTIGS